MRGAHTDHQHAGAIRVPSRELRCPAMSRRRIRPFRIGLWMGILGAVLWYVQRQRDRAVPAPSVVPARPVPPSPAARAEPAPTPAPVEAAVVEPQPARPAAPVKKAAPKRTEPLKAAKKSAAKKAPARSNGAGRIPATWVVPEPGGICPTSHPVKAKLSSKLFHLPGMFAYDRTNPDRCYRDEAAAEADGLHRAKR